MIESLEGRARPASVGMAAPFVVFFEGRSTSRVCWQSSRQAGEILGNIPARRGLISVAFGGPGKRALFGIAIRDVQILAIDTIAQSHTGRPK